MLQLGDSDEGTPVSVRVASERARPLQRQIQEQVKGTYRAGTGTRLIYTYISWMFSLSAIYNNLRPPLILILPITSLDINQRNILY